MGHGFHKLGMAVHSVWLFMHCEKGKCSKPWYVLSQTATAKEDCPEFLHLAATVSYSVGDSTGRADCFSLMVA